MKSSFYALLFFYIGTNHLLYADPLLIFDFDEPVGVTTFEDRSGSNRDATCTPPACPTVIAAGPFQSYISLDGGDYLSIPAFNYGATYSLSFWLKPSNATGTEVLFSKWADATTESIQVFLSNSDIVARSFSGDDVWIGRTAASDLSVDWQHIVITYDGGTTAAAVKIYKNGVQEDSADNVSGSFSSFNDLNIATEIGSQGGGATLYTGYIDDLILFEQVLNAREVHRLYGLSLQHFHVPSPNQFAFSNRLKGLSEFNPRPLEQVAYRF